MTINRQETFGVWLTREFENRGLVSGPEQAKFLGSVSHSTVGDWKAGKRAPKLENLEVIAKAFGMPLWRVLVAAGMIPPPDDWRPQSIEEIPTRELLAEVERRVEGA